MITLGMSEMPRIRYVKPGLFINTELARCSFAARLLFIGLWCWADREGRLKDEPRVLRSQILGLDEGVDMTDLLSQLETNGFIERYTVQGKGYIQVVNFAVHQRPHPQEQPSRFPPPPSTLKTEHFLTTTEHEISRGDGDGNGDGDGDGDGEHAAVAPGSPEEASAVLGALDEINERAVSRDNAAVIFITQTARHMPDVDPVLVALDYAIWQNSLSVGRRHKNLIQGWRKQMTMRAENDAFFRHRPARRLASKIISIDPADRERIQKTYAALRLPSEDRHA